MKILLGTISAQKIKIVDSFFKSEEIEADIIPIDVDSDIVEQPLNESITIQGSINRAKNAILSYKSEFDFGLGLEAGLKMSNGVYNLICVVTLIDNNESIYSGVSSEISLPEQVSEAVKNGGEFGIIIREFQKNNPSDKKENPDLINELIYRTISFSAALKIAYKKYNFSKK